MYRRAAADERLLLSAIDVLRRWRIFLLDQGGCAWARMKISSG
jgi:hypothetical protein